IQPSSVQIDAPRISVSQNSVTITTSTDNATQTFEVYSMTGQLVKRITTTDRSATFELPRGCYIVRCGRWSKKIIIN
ncbi:MAG: T9SS type A sorting domain-containing protein, partial [Paramuribaculum sp.]|nr:T9SS type A sorting domain-containing protein [Paramuribaculum sp.]